MALRMVDRLEELQRRRQYAQMHEGSSDEDTDDVPMENSSFVERGFGTGYRLSMIGDGEPKQSPRMLTFFSIVDDVRHCIAEITFRNEEIGQVQSSLLSKPPAAHQADKEKHFQLIDEVKRYSVRVHKGLKKIEDEIKADEKGGLDGKSMAEFRIKKNQFTSLVFQLKQAMTQFRRLEEEHREKSKNIIKRQIQAMDPDSKMTDSQLESAIDDESFSIVTVQDHKRLLLDEVEARKKEMHELEQNIQELNEIFLNMMFLIDEQGEMIDHIEHNVTSALAFVDKGNKAIKVSVYHRRQNRRLKFIICVILTVVIVFVALVLVLGAILIGEYFRDATKVVMPTVVAPTAPDIVIPSPTRTRPNLQSTFSFS